MSEVAKSQATAGPRDRRKGSVRTRGSQHSALLKDGPAPPDKTAYEEKIKKLTSHIEEKEKQIKHAPTDNADLSAQMRSKGEEMEGVEADRLKVNQEVRKVEQNIKRLGDEVAKEKESANRLAVELRFRSESTYDQHIAKLQRQVQAGDFLRPDDRVKVKLEAEIEKLKRCKVRLREYLTAKLKIDSKVNDQDTLRKKRDFLYCEEKKLKERKVKLRDAQEELRQRMEDRKGKQKEFKAQQAELKREIDELYKQRKELRESFTQEQAQYTETLRKARQAFYDEQREAAKRKDIERKIAREARKKEREAEKEMKREQEFDVERTTCRALISFLKNVTPAADESSVEGSPEGASASITQTSPPTKRAEEEWVPAGGRRKSKRDKKKSSAKVQHKNLHLNPTTLYQFTQLRMSPPFSVSQIPTVLEELNCKLRMYEVMNRAQSEAGDSGIGMYELNEPVNGEQTLTCGAAHDKSDTSVSPSPCSSPMLGKSSPNTSDPKPQVEPSTPSPQTIIPEPIESHPSIPTTVSS